KTFGRRLIFNGINFRYDESGVFGISGPNGSGKSTLVKIIAGLISPTKGRIIHKNSEDEVIPEELHNHIGFVSPYLVLYEEFTAWENLNIFSKIREIKFDEDYAKELLNRFLLFNRRDDLVKTYSSGMKQRMKFIFALIHHPELLIFDEPTSNLDDEGKNSVYEIIEDKSKESIIIIASNDKADLDLCSQILDLKTSK
ncbi:MAG: ABC transporter ATP-binding protein, partial [Ignavibacteriaceae bacterium]